MSTEAPSLTPNKSPTTPLPQNNCGRITGTIALSVLAIAGISMAVLGIVALYTNGFKSWKFDKAGDADLDQRSDGEAAQLE